MGHIVWIVFVFIIVISRMLKATGASRGDQMTSSNSLEEAERARRFREALGLPPDSNAPGPLPPKRVRINPAPMLPVQPPPALPGRLRRVPVVPVAPVPQEAVEPDEPAEPAAPVLTSSRKVRVLKTSQPFPATAPSPQAQPQPQAIPERSSAPLAPQASMAAYRQEVIAEGSQRRTNKRSGEVLDLLRRHSTARGAIILKEVLGPPKALA